MEEGGKRRLSRVAPDSQAIFIPTFLNTCCMRWKCARDLQQGSRREHEHIHAHAFSYRPSSAWRVRHVTDHGLGSSEGRAHITQSTVMPHQNQRSTWAGVVAVLAVTGAIGALYVP